MLSNWLSFVQFADVILLHKTAAVSTIAKLVAQVFFFLLAMVVMVRVTLGLGFILFPILSAIIHANGSVLNFWIPSIPQILIHSSRKNKPTPQAKAKQSSKSPDFKLSFYSSISKSLQVIILLPVLPRPQLIPLFCLPSVATFHSIRSTGSSSPSVWRKTSENTSRLLGAEGVHVWFCSQLLSMQVPAQQIKAVIQRRMD